MNYTRLPLVLVAVSLPALAYVAGRATRDTEAGVSPFAPIAPAVQVATEPVVEPPAEAGPEPVAETSPTVAVVTDTPFGRLIERLSEAGGYFDSDNLISNEASYLHVMGKLERLGVTGGAYLGVGPDQNFSYIARIRPTLAFMVDIRRDNLLQHFLFKALFTEARNRLEYLCLLFGKPVPRDVEKWSDREVGELLAYVDTAASDGNRFDRTAKKVAEQVRGFGYVMADADVATIRRLHAAFFEAGLGLRFSSYGRSPRSYYPTYRQLLLETDLDGRHGNYLASEEDFQFLRQMQREDRIIPVVGDLSGDHALTAIADYLRERQMRVSAFYTSNVEFYLMAEGRFDQFARNVAQLPRADNGVIIRSYFGRSYRHPQAVAGYASTQLLQMMDSFVTDETAGGYRSYSDLVVRRMVDLRGDDGDARTSRW